MHKVSESDKRLAPEQVSKDNSDIWRYSPDLYSALRKEKFSKANPEAYMDYLDAVGEIGLFSPYEGIDLQMDIEKFKKTLEDQDREIFGLLMMGMRQQEISDVVGICRSAISKKLTKLRIKFKEFYEE